ncbi:MAG: hypothetical protein LQ351_001895 [Letrouitia transgressa]|nr:MAG: hypothetical protein LQ351_001895 [Letrouitia transgressa]
MTFISGITSPRPSSSGTLPTPSTLTHPSIVDDTPHSTESHANSLPVLGVPHSGAKRRSSKTKTTYKLAHPPPTLRHKQRLRIRPKILLQLHQTSEASRPTPILDVLPSVTFAPHFARKFPRIFHGRDGLGPDDLIVVKSENYETLDASKKNSKVHAEGEKWDHREVVAAVCQLRKGDGTEDKISEISLNNGPPWQASVFKNGAYEFLSKNDEGVCSIARWVPQRSVNRKQNAKTRHLSSTSLTSESIFKFSLINPNSRRHPVLATMTDQSIDILDRYSVPNATTLPCQTFEPAESPEVNGSFDDASETGSMEKKMIEVDDHLRTLVIVTGIWVAFREGWSPNFNYHSSPEDTKLLRRKRNASVNIPNTTEFPSHDILNLDQGPSGKSRPGIISTASFSSAPSSPMLHSETAVPQRARSIGTAILQRANRRQQEAPVSPGPASPVLTMASPESSDDESDYRVGHEVELGEEKLEWSGPRTRETSLTSSRASGLTSTLVAAEDQADAMITSGATAENNKKLRRLRAIFNFVRGSKKAR